MSHAGDAAGEVWVRKMIFEEFFRSLWRRVSGKETDPALHTSTLAADTPIRTAAEDLLGRREFAGALAKVLYRHRSDESLVVALRGEWGSGKTSVKNLVVEALGAEKVSPMKVVGFNPWQWGSDEAITRAFFREISAALGDADASLAGRRRAFEFRRYADILEHFSVDAKSASERTSGMVGWLGNVGLIVAGAGVITLDLPAKTLAAVLLGLSGTLLLISKIIAWLGRDREDQRPLDIARARLEDRLKTLPRNILVVIDDIDRLEAEQIRLVIRHVKANANLPGLTYLLLYQRDIVERAFEGNEPGSGRKHLEKIVQAAFDVPPVEGRRIGSIVLAELERISSQNPNDTAEFDQVRWGNMWTGGLRLLFRNLRDVRRFIGSAEVQFELQRGARVLETNVIDTIALEALRVFEPEVFANIARSKTALTGMRERRDKDKEGLQASVSLASKENSSAVQYLLKQMFPVIGWAFGSSWHGPDWEEKWAKERRICAVRYFDRYFALRLPDGQISDSEFLDFVDHTGDRAYLDEAFADLEKRGLLTEMLDRLDEIKTKIPIENADVFLPTLFDIAERFPDTMGFSDQMPFISAWRTASWYLRSERDQEKRDEIFLRALGKAAGLGVPATLIGLDIDRRSKEREDEFLFTDFQLSEAKRAWVEKLKNSLELHPVDMLRNSHLASYLYRWREFADEGGPREWVTSIVEQPALLPKLLSAFMQEGESHTLGDYVTRKQVSFRLESILPFVDVPSLVTKAKELPACLDEREQTARAKFLDAAERYRNDLKPEEGGGKPPHEDPIT
jgi:hypothetical protein